MSTERANAASVLAESTAEGDLAESKRRIELAAASIPVSELKGFRGYADVMSANAGVAAEALRSPEVRARLVEHFVKVDGDALVRDVLEGVAVLDHLARAARRDETEKVTLRLAVKDAETKLAVLDPTIDAAVAQGIIAADKAEALPARKGRSYEALGGRLIDAAMLLKWHEAQLAGRTLVRDEELDRAIETGMFLRDTHAKRRARIKRSRTAMAERRDRVYTWLLGRYDELRRVGAFLFGRDVDRHVPPLASHKIARRKVEADGAPQPVVDPAPSSPGTGSPASAAVEQVGAVETSSIPAPAPALPLAAPVSSAEPKPPAIPPSTPPMSWPPNAAAEVDTGERGPGRNTCPGAA